MKVSSLLAMLSFALATPAPAQTDEGFVRDYMTGVELTEKCRSYLAMIRSGGQASGQQAFDGGICWGFVAGVLESVDFEGLASTSSGAPAFCLPSDVNANIMVEIVAQYGDEHPTSQRMSGYNLTRFALAQSFPCP